MNRKEIIIGLQQMLMACNAADSDNPPELGGNDLDPRESSQYDGLYGYVFGALLQLDQGPSVSYWGNTGDWVMTEDMTADQLETVKDDYRAAPPALKWFTGD